MTAESLNTLVAAGAAVLLLGVAAVRASASTGLPGLLLYLGIGVALGESGVGIQFSDAQLTQAVGTFLLALILIEGGLTTQWAMVRRVLAPAALSATLGVLISVAVVAAAGHYVLGVDVRTAVLIGAVISSTDAAAVFAILRRLPVKARLRGLVEAESGFNDPPVIVLVLVVTSPAWFAASPAAMVADGLYQLGVGAVVGVVMAVAGGWVLARVALPSAGLYPLATLALALCAFGAAGMLGGSGLLACFVAGLYLGNVELPHQQATRGVAESAAWLAQIALFVLLGLLASPSRLPEAVLPALVVGCVLTFVARPLSVVVCTAPFRMPWREQVFVSWAGLRGAVPIVLATIPIAVGMPSAERIFDTVFVLVVVFTLVQGPLLPWVARRTGVLDSSGALELDVESAPLDRMSARLVQVEVPAGSRLAGVYLDELALPARAVVALVVRDGHVMRADEAEPLRAGDAVLIAVEEGVAEATVARLRAVGRAGRLAGWRGEHGHEAL